MSTLATRRFTVDELQRMADTGVLRPDERVELIEGVIVEMGPIGPPEQGQLNRLNALLVPLVAGRAIAAVHGPVILSEHTQPQPDLALLAVRDDWYTTGHARPPAILLAVEVADSSLAYDREVKAPLYARSGVPELWVVDVNAHRLEVLRQPSSDGYATRAVLAPGDRVAVDALPGVEVAVSDLLG